MTVEKKNLAKSLHTVSVLVNLGRHLMTTESLTAKAAVKQALVILDLNGKTDQYDLCGVALKQLGA